MTAVALLALLGALATGTTTGGDVGTASARRATGPIDPARSTPVPQAPPARATGSEQGARPAAIRFTTPTGPNPTALRACYGQRPAWKICGNGPDQCASVRVPVDYARPEGATVAISLHKVVAINPKERKGTLFINPGGPGESGLGFVEAADSVSTPHVRARFDIVGFDPRAWVSQAASSA